MKINRKYLRRIISEATGDLGIELSDSEQEEYFNKMQSSGETPQEMIVSIIMDAMAQSGMPAFSQQVGASTQIMIPGTEEGQFVEILVKP